MNLLAFIIQECIVVISISTSRQTCAQLRRLHLGVRTGLHRLHCCSLPLLLRQPRMVTHSIKLLKSPPHCSRQVGHTACRHSPAKINVLPRATTTALPPMASTTIPDIGLVTTCIWHFGRTICGVGVRPASVHPPQDHPRFRDRGKGTHPPADMVTATVQDMRAVNVKPHFSPG